MWSSCSERGNRGLKPHRTVSLPTSMWLKPKVSQIKLHRGKLSVDHMIYPLVNVYITMENHHAIIGKPSISMGHLYHGYVSHNHRVYPYISFYYTIYTIYITLLYHIFYNQRVYPYIPRNFSHDILISPGSPLDGIFGSISLTCLEFRRSEQQR